MILDLVEFASKNYLKTYNPNQPKVGDIIFAYKTYYSYLPYKHFGIYLGNNKVIHYHGESIETALIQEDSIETFLKNSIDNKLHILETISSEVENDFSVEETIARAKSRLGEKAYGLLMNNCEHFAMWCKYGTKKSTQVENVISLASKIGYYFINSKVAV